MQSHGTNLRDFISSVSQPFTSGFRQVDQALRQIGDGTQLNEEQFRQKIENCIFVCLIPLVVQQAFFSWCGVMCWCHGALCNAVIFDRDGSTMLPVLPVLKSRHFLWLPACPPPCP